MEMVKPTNDFAVICHGDLWLSNILFKYGMPICSTGEGGGGGCGGSIDALDPVWPVEVKFIDFQSSRFASLATDLVLFLFTSVRVSQIWITGTIHIFVFLYAIPLIFLILSVGFLLIE